jgi:hypothetical protein
MTHPAAYAYVPLAGYLLRVVRGDAELAFGPHATPEAVADVAAYGAEREEWRATEADQFAAIADPGWWDQVAAGRRGWAARYREIMALAADEGRGAPD